MDFIEDRSLVRSEDRPDLEAPFLNPAFLQAPSADDGILKRLRRRKSIMVTTFVLVGVLAATAFLVQTPAYRAVASVVIAPPEHVLAPEAQSDTTTVGDIPDLESQGVILGSAMIVRQMLTNPEAQAALMDECAVRRTPSWKSSALDFVGLGPKNSCADELADVTKTVAALQTRLSIGVNGRSRVIDVMFTSPVPKVAQTIADGIVATYLASERQDRLRPRDTAINWLRSEAAKVAERLKANELGIQTFLQAKGVVNGQRGSLASEQLTNLALLVSQAESDRAAIAGRMRQTGTDVGGSVLDNKAVTEIKQQLATVTARLAQVSASYGSAAPQVQELTQQRITLQRLLSQETGTVSRSANADYQAATDRVANLRSQLEQLKQNVRGNDEAATQVASLQREVATDRDLYVDLTRSLNKLETDRRLVTTSARLVSMAELPEKVFLPKDKQLRARRLGVGRRRRRCCSRWLETEPIARIAALAILPMICNCASWPICRMSPGSAARPTRSQGASKTRPSSKRRFAGCTRNASYSDRAARLAVHAVFCSLPPEAAKARALRCWRWRYSRSQRGTACSSSSATSGAQASPAACLSGEGVGLADILRGKASPEQGVQECRPGLDVIAGGAPTMDSTELLGGSRLKQVLSWATANYDLVLIDAPASRALQDARILAGKGGWDTLLRQVGPFRHRSREQRHRRIAGCWWACHGACAQSGRAGPLQSV